MNQRDYERELGKLGEKERKCFAKIFGGAMRKVEEIGAKFMAMAKEKKVDVVKQVGAVGLAILIGASMASCDKEAVKPATDTVQTENNYGDETSDTIKENENTGGENSGNETSGGENSGNENPGTETPGGDNTGNENQGGENPGGDNTGGENQGGETPGGDNTGGENQGGETPGTETPGGDNTGNENQGGENPGGDNTGGENQGGETPGTETPGGDNTGNENQGGENSGGDNTGGENQGGETPGTETPGGDNTGGENQGGNTETPPEVEDMPGDADGYSYPTIVGAAIHNDIVNYNDLDLAESLYNISQIPYEDIQILFMEHGETKAGNLYPAYVYVAFPIGEGDLYYAKFEYELKASAYKKLSKFYNFTSYKEYADKLADAVWDANYVGAWASREHNFHNYDQDTIEQLIPIIDSDFKDVNIICCQYINNREIDDYVYCVEGFGCDEGGNIIKFKTDVRPNNALGSIAWDEVVKALSTGEIDKYDMAYLNTTSYRIDSVFMHQAETTGEMQ